jgi:hypothetical protein
MAASAMEEVRSIATAPATAAIDGNVEFRIDRSCYEIPNRRDGYRNNERRLNRSFTGATLIGWPSAARMVRVLAPGADDAVTPPRLGLR